MDTILKKKKGMQKKHIPYIIGSVLVIALALFVAIQNHRSSLNVEMDKITIETVTKGEFDDYITVIGQVEPITTIYLDALEGGRVVERYIEEGEMVKKGDVILKLENRELYQTILISETSLAEKENYLRTARINFEVDRIQSKRNLLETSFCCLRQLENLSKTKSFSKTSSLLKKNIYRPKKIICTRKNCLK